jgi:predicted O-methyltransferase YrrM
MSKMIAGPENYFRGLISERDPVLKRLEEEADVENIPIIGPAIGSLLFVITRFGGVRRVLEFGTATGYSAIWMARGCSADDAMIVTLEKDPAMAERARRNCDLAGVGARVQIHTGDALAVAKDLAGPFDMIFLDIEKKDYLAALDHCRRLLRPDGLLLADNVAFTDADPFNQALCRDPRWQAAPLYGFIPDHSPEHDGICLAVLL